MSDEPRRSANSPWSGCDRAALLCRANSQAERRSYSLPPDAIFTSASNPGDPSRLRIRAREGERRKRRHSRARRHATDLSEDEVA